MRFDIVTTSSDFQSLKKDWNDLIKVSRDPAITQTWEWMKTWWDVYGHDRNLVIVCCRENNRLIGLAPLSVLKDPIRHFRCVDYRVMSFLGSGQTSARGVVSDYLGCIVEDGFEKEFTYNFFKFIKKIDIWDEMILENISEDSLQPELIQQAAFNLGLNYTQSAKTQSILIKLPETWDAFLKSISSSLRYKINRGRKELEKIGACYRLIQDESELPDAIGHLERLHQHRWNSKGIQGAFSSKEWKTFHTLLMSALLPQDRLKLSFIEVDNQPVAANYNFKFDNKIHFFQSGIMPHENKHIRLGLLLHSYCIEQAISDGLNEYDFLSVGASGPGYKTMWGNYERDLVSIRIAKKNTNETIYTGLNALRKYIKKVYSTIKSSY